MISANFKISQFLNKDIVRALKGAKFTILSVFLEKRLFLSWKSCKSPSNG